MTYLRAALLALAAAVALGVAAGTTAAVVVSRELSRAGVIAEGIATALNCAALYALVLVPAAVVGLFVERTVTRKR